METHVTLLAQPKAIALLGDEVAVQTLVLLSRGDVRFNQIEAGLSVRPKLLSARLKRLQEQGLITRVSYPEIPPRVVYGLTEKGRELVTILQGIAEWDASWHCKSS